MSSVVLARTRLLNGVAIAYMALGLAAAAHLLERNSVVEVSPAGARWLSFASAYWLVLTVIWAKVTIGSAALRLPIFARLHLRPLERALFAYGTGSFLVYTVLLLLGLARALTPLGLMWLAALWLGCGWVCLRWPSTSDPLPGEAEGKAWPAVNRWALGLLTAGWLAPLFLQTLLPTTDADAWMYHLPLAERFVSVGLWEVDPYFPAFDFVGAISLFYSLFLVLGEEGAIVPYNFVCGLILLAVVYALARRFWSREVSVWAVLLAIGCNVVWECATTPRIDSQLALYFVLACFAFLLWLESPDRSGSLLLLGMMIGMTLGIKYTAVLFPPLFALMLLGAFVQARRFPVWGTLAMLTLLLVPSSFWYARNWFLLGDPVYPMLFKQNRYVDDSGVLRDFSLLAQKFEGQAHSPEELDAALASHKGFGVGGSAAREETQPMHSLNLLTVILAPHWYEMKPFHTVTPYVLLIFWLPFVAHDRFTVWLLLLAAAFYVALGAQYWVIRYPLPALLLFPIGGGVVLTRFARGDTRRRSVGWRWGLGLLSFVIALMLLRDWWILFTSHPATPGLSALWPLIVPFGLLSAIVLLQLTRPTFNTTPAARALLSLTALLVAANITRDWSCEVVRLLSQRPTAYLLGRESRWEFLKHAETTGIVDLTEEINQQISRGAIDAADTILMLGEYKGYLLGMHYLPDNNFAGYRWRVEIMKAGGDPAELRTRLLEQGIRYILINDAQIEWFQTGEPRLFDRHSVGFGLYYLNRLLQGGHARVIHEGLGMRIVKLD